MVLNLRGWEQRRAPTGARFSFSPILGRFVGARGVDHLRLPFERSGAWLSAEAATDFCAGVDFGLDRIFDAFEATLDDVFSFFAMMGLSVFRCVDVTIQVDELAVDHIDVRTAR